ncbi:MAG: hypothetical protein NTV61_11515 [Candidatus Bathyarchaeota archaeon]|nr:hypothetical protein [Candidatus Bathyarchaeota archaeon]
MSFNELRRRDPDGLILEEFENSLYRLLNVCEFCQYLNRETYSCNHSGGPLNWNSHCSKFVRRETSKKDMTTAEFDRRVSQLEREYGLCEPYHLIIWKCGKETNTNAKVPNSC